MYFKELGFSKGAEIGVLDGGFSVFMCQTNPNLKLYCVDSWGNGERSNRMRNYHLKMYARAKIKLAPYNATLIKKLSIDAVNDFKNNSLDFVYIDANHSTRNVLEDVTVWTDKVKHHGFVSGHDYDSLSVKQAVDDYIKKNRLRIKFNGTGSTR